MSLLLFAANSIIKNKLNYDDRLPLELKYMIDHRKSKYEMIDELIKKYIYIQNNKYIRELIKKYNETKYKLLNDDDLFNFICDLKDIEDRFLFEESEKKFYMEKIKDYEQYNDSLELLSLNELKNTYEIALRNYFT